MRQALGAGARPPDPPASDREPRHRSLRRTARALPRARRRRPPHAVPAGREPPRSPRSPSTRAFSSSPSRRRSLTGVLFGLLPALQRAEPASALPSTRARAEPRAARPADPLAPGRGRVRPRARAARRRGPARPHALEPAPGRSRASTHAGPGRRASGFPSPTSASRAATTRAPTRPRSTERFSTGSAGFPASRRRPARPASRSGAAVRINRYHIEGRDPEQGGTVDRRDLECDHRLLRDAAASR